MAQTYYACLVAGEGLMHIRWFFYRDYFLDAIDHLSGAEAFSSFYPRLSFGPGQRYLSKGCYILKLGAGDQLVQDSSWISVGP